MKHLSTIVRIASLNDMEGTYNVLVKLNTIFNLPSPNSLNRFLKYLLTAAGLNQVVNHLVMFFFLTTMRSEEKASLNTKRSSTTVLT